MGYVVVFVLELGFGQCGTRGGGVVYRAVVSIYQAFLYHLLEYAELAHFVFVVCNVMLSVLEV